MLMIRTLPLSPPPCYSQLRRLLLPASRLLQFQRMNSFDSSANPHALPDSPCHGSSGGGDEKCSDDKDHSSDVIMIGKIRVCLNCKGNRQKKSLSPSYVNEYDDIESGIDKKGIPPNVLSSHHDNEFPPVSGQNTKRSRKNLELERGLKNNTSSFPVESFELLSSNIQRDEASLLNQFGKKNKPSYNEKRRSVDIGSKSSPVTANLPPFQPFDICSSGRRGNAKSGGSWQVKEEIDCRVLRPGMVLLKHYITPRDQVRIVKTCQKLGLGPGGFYQPGYKGGAKLRLQMMCLGLDWDPQTRKYGHKRSVDDNEPPKIPTKFAVLVEKALKDALALIKNQSNTNNIEDILPTMSPDICIVNFYTTSGRLGLHQDRDESEESLASGLPVVSFSVGNSAEFLYGNRRDVDKAEKIVLESGDVLIFGGESRHVFHGVSSIIPKSMPKFLLDHTGLRPGRLNLTFRKY